MTCHVTGGVRVKTDLPPSPFRKGFYSVNAFTLAPLAVDPLMTVHASSAADKNDSTSVVRDTASVLEGRELVHGSEGHLFFDPVISADGSRLCYVDCLPAEDPAHMRADIWLASRSYTLNGGGGGREEWGHDWTHRQLTFGQRHWFGTAYGRAGARGGGSNTAKFSPDGESGALATPGGL